MSKNAPKARLKDLSESEMTEGQRALATCRKRSERKPRVFSRRACRLLQPTATAGVEMEVLMQFT
jgi:hypothetical protein